MQISGQGDYAGRHGMGRRAFVGLALASLPGTLVADGSVDIIGIEYMSLRTVAGHFGMKYNWLSNAKSARLSSQWTRMDYTLHQRYQTLNGVRVYLGAPVALHRDSLHVAKLDYERTLQPLLSPRLFRDVPKLYHIVIDAGHGGKDVGAVNERLNLYEKDLALSVALRLGNLLAKLGYKITYTRTNDVYLSLDERSAAANAHQADLFISIHFNASSTHSVRGVETYTMTPQHQASSSGDPTKNRDKQYYPGNDNDVWNTLVGFYTQRELTKLPQAQDRGLKRARFAVIREARCPALLVEGGFLSNDNEGRLLENSRHQELIAQAITTGISSYQRTLNRLRGLS